MSDSGDLKSGLERDVTRRTLAVRGAQVGGVALGGGALASFLAACGGGGDDGGSATGATGTSGSASSGAKGGSTTLKMAALDVAQGLDADIFVPGMQLAVINLYDALVTYGPGKTYPNGGQAIDAAKIVPQLATSWNPSKDGKSFIVKLRQGVKSGAGNELTAEDVAWSWAKSISQQRTGAFIAGVCNVAKVEAIDKYTAKFVLKAPSAILERALALYVPMIVDSTEAKKHATKSDPYAEKWLAKNAAGFGAYVIESLKPANQLVLVPNENYWGEKPYFQRIEINQVPDPSTRVTLLTTGEVNYVDQLNFRQLDTVAKSPGSKVVSIPTGNISEQGEMNVKTAPFDKTEVRQALNFAIDQQAILKAEFEGRSTAMKSILPPVVPGYDTSFYNFSYDPERAKSLLAQAGHSDGIEVTLNYSNIQWFDEPFAIQLQSSAEKAGIKINLQEIQSATLYDKTVVGKQTLPFFVVQEVPQVLDPGYAMALEATPSGASDRTAYDNPQFTKLVTEANQTLDKNKRLALLTQAQKIFMADPPWVFGAYPGAQGAMAKSVSGWIWHSDNMPHFAELKGSAS